jgi:hypothetical protein
MEAFKGLPGLAEKNLGPGTNHWVTIYTGETLVLLFKPSQKNQG